VPAALPIDSILDQVTAHLRAENALCLEAPPGAGKTTRVPSALLDSGAVDGEIIVLEPRRLAARLSAVRVAEERGEPLGEQVGYRVRFEEKVSARTRLQFVTEGVLLRRLADDPTLDRVGALVFDEFHERHLTADLSLALCRRLQLARPSLRLCVMSATLESAPVAEFLGGCQVLRTEGRRFDVAIDYLPRPPDADRKLEQEVAAALRRLIADGLDGDVLVFLPGAAEIRRAAAACAEPAARAGLEMLPLHGDLAPAEQDRAVRRGSRPKLILSTNVAETSVTIDGVVAVIDSGLARIASHSPWSGLPTLRVSPISRASAAQRAGRAGRTRPGRCLRLYTRHDHDARPAHTAPEVRRADLSEPLLLLASFGVRPVEFAWFESPTPAALDAASTLLTRLGALDAAGAITPVGRRMLKFPLHPRQARILVEAERLGITDDAVTAVAVIGEGGLRHGRGPSRESGPSDLDADLDRFAEAERVRFDIDRLRSSHIDAGAARAVDRVRKQLSRLVARQKTEKPRSVPTALQRAVLSGYPDRVAKRRRARERELVLSGGGQARLDEGSVVHDADLMVAIDAEERGAAGKAGAVTVRCASAIEPDWLIELDGSPVREVDEYLWNAQAGRVDRVRRLVYDALTVDEEREPARVGDEGASAVLLQAARERGARSFCDAEALERFLGRVAFVREQVPDAGMPPLGDAEIDAALGELCQGQVRLDALSEGALLELLRARLGAQGRLVDELAPDRVTLARGRGVRITYTPGQPPFIASRLQDFFGMSRGPAVARGRVPLTLHLLAPNQRAVQVTSDLAGFWEKHYPAIRRELCRRYPRHKWPEDPMSEG
jgi:ATP-dependent helicase HrpB